MPNFYLGNEKECPNFLHLLDSLYKIWKFFSDTSYSKKFGDKLELLFKDKNGCKEPKLKPEKPEKPAKIRAFFSRNQKAVQKAKNPQEDAIVGNIEELKKEFDEMMKKMSKIAIHLKIKDAKGKMKNLLEILIEFGKLI